MENQSLEKEKSSSGRIVTGILFGLSAGAAAAICLVCVPFITPAFRRFCLPFVPATDSQMLNILTALRGRTGSLVDIGSGDGRIVIAAAQNGFSPAHGVELNFFLVLYSKLSAFRLGLSSRASFFRRDLWKFNLQPYQNVVIFGVEEMMTELEKKMIQELNDESCIIACRFPLPSLKPLVTIGSGIDTVWVYKNNK